MPRMNYQTRRTFLRDSFCGMGSLALAAMCRDDLRADDRNPLSAKLPPRPDAKAKSVVFLFMAGGPIHLETFDPKPLLNKLHGQPRPAIFGEAKYQFVATDAKLLGSQRRFAPAGQSGVEVSDLFPYTSR